ncbi:MAG: anhydro-N-acetylmuramic acid kinase [Proteobacteria bacterium]|nr:anhydro-N-acetylmuramic acid kinase [Pseudomonadota bacterium]
MPIGPQHYIGLMSGTSLDGVDGVLATFDDGKVTVRAHHHLPFQEALRAELLALCSPGEDEIRRAGRAGNRLAGLYAEVVEALLGASGLAPAVIRAIGCHGQTVRHHPDEGYTVQIGNAARLAERCGIPVVADFRSRDIAAGGQGAPLVPAFHTAVFGNTAECRAMVNLGGIANLTCLCPDTPVLGFDTGPGNALMDFWVQRNRGERFDDRGVWAAGTLPDGALLRELLDEPYFARPAPKSTGRELFNRDWLLARLPTQADPQVVQATLLELTAQTLCDALALACPRAARLIVCGGGARNDALLARLGALLAPVSVDISTDHGVGIDQVEACAFAWLARCTLEGKTGNLPSVTGAAGARVLGAIYPA